MRSDRIKRGIERAPHRALLRATGVTDADLTKPFVAGDPITIDLARRSLDLGLPTAEIERRQKALPAFVVKSSSRWLRRYAKWVGSASTGAVFLDD